MRGDEGAARYSFSASRPHIRRYAPPSPRWGEEGARFDRLPKPLLVGRKALTVITSDTPTFFLKWLYGNGWVKVLRRQILAFCGFTDLRVEYFNPVHGGKARGAGEDSVGCGGDLGLRATLKP
jgi:hypothetical protein